MSKDMNLKTSIVGSSFYPGAGSIIMRLRPGTELQLVREPNNAYDKNAIAVYFSNTKLGHIGRGVASLLAPRMDAGLVVKCTKHPAQGAVAVLQWNDEMAPAAAPAVETDTDDILRRFRGLSI